MFAHKTLKVVLALAGLALPGLAQGPWQVSSVRDHGFASIPALRSELLELRLNEATSPATLEVRGGEAGHGACLAVAPDAGTMPALTHGRFDAEGRFAIPVDLAAWSGRSLVAQGFGLEQGLDGRVALRASNGLRISIEAAPSTPAPEAAPAPDFSFLRIDLGPCRGAEAWQQVRERDLVGALTTALNSSGDGLLAKLSGKVLVPVFGPLSLGGSVSYSAKITREADEYLVAIGRDVAVLCGVKATDDVGVEAGIGLGADEIYRFASPGEVARGLLGIGLRQALPNAFAALNTENLARLQHARRAVLGLRASLQALRAARPALGSRVAELAMERILTAAEAAFAVARRVGDALERIAVRLVTEAMFVRESGDGVEARFSLTGELSLKVGSKTFRDAIGFELGGKVNGAYQVTVRTYQSYGASAERIELTLSHAVGASFAAGVKLGSLKEIDVGGAKQANEAGFGRGIEVAMTTTRAIKTVFEERSGSMTRQATTLILKREWKLPVFSRETTIEFDAAALGAAGLATLIALSERDGEALRDTLAGISATVTVQDKRTLALKPEVGFDKSGVVVKVGLEASWTDAGPARTTTSSLGAIVHRLRDVAGAAAEAAELARQAVALGAGS